MKVSCDLDITVSMGNANHEGTGRQGFLPTSITYLDLVEIFGEPQITSSPHGKIQAEWVGKINGLIFTIYDYKSDIAPEDNTDWHIGGKVKLVDELLNLYVKAKLNKKASQN